MEKDNINPAHYRQQPYECIEFTENMNFNLGNAFKYIWQYRDKNGIEDLKKARWYLQKQLDSAPLFSLLNLEVYCGLCRKFGQCRFEDERYILLGNIINHCFFKDEVSLNVCLETLSCLIRLLESENAKVRI